ncbi:MAG: hypothetical protein AMK71_01060 [Nitrospira bacterium SG8_35_4]|nr:MAG: hypothetical protein AMK71_01060 [Nitrospira bacterium SG8_35_4]
MKVVLIQPPVQDFYNTEIRLQPIGLSYLKSAVQMHVPEADVIIKDYHAGYGRKTIPLPVELAYLKDYYPVADKSPFSLFHQYYHFGASFDLIGTEIRDLKPDLVGISSLFTAYYREALTVARVIKESMNIPIVMGGPHVSEAPESVLSSPAVDYVIRGEGEKPFVELIRYLRGMVPLQDVPGLGYKKDSIFHLNPVTDNYPLDQLPFPDLSDSPPARYHRAGKPLAFMITSRGCPHHCSFCSVNMTFGNRHRRRSVSTVIEEIKQRYQEGYRVVDFEDDNLTWHKDDFRELCGRLITLFPDREMEFVAMNGISYMSLDEDILELMFRAGFSELNLALVSAGTSTRRNVQRPHTLDAYAGIVSTAFQVGFKTVSYQILGLPDETLESMVQTLAYNARLPVLLGASPFYRTPKAPLSKGRHFSEEDFVRARLSALAEESESFSREDIYTLFVSTRIINFLKGLPLPESADLNDLLHQTWTEKRVRTGVELLKELMHSRTLYFQTTHGRVPNRKFRTDLFLNLLQEAGSIACQNGKRITIG